MVLETLSSDKNEVTGCYILDMKVQKTFKIGRGHTSDLRLTDISVSRNHAVLRLDGDKFILEDDESKFGSLIFLRKPIPICGEFSQISI